MKINTAVKLLVGGMLALACFMAMPQAAQAYPDKINCVVNNDGWVKYPNSGLTLLRALIHAAAKGDDDMWACREKIDIQVAKIINEWATVKVREHWPWITMPLKMEAEISEVDGSWADMSRLNFKDA